MLNIFTANAFTAKISCAEVLRIRYNLGLGEWRARGKGRGKERGREREREGERGREGEGERKGGGYWDIYCLPLLLSNLPPLIDFLLRILSQISAQVRQIRNLSAGRPEDRCNWCVRFLLIGNHTAQVRQWTAHLLTTASLLATASVLATCIFMLLIT